MKVGIYTSDFEDSITAVVVGDVDDGKLPKDAVFVREIEGENWEDCMRQHHELMGWEPYVPFSLD